MMRPARAFRFLGDQPGEGGLRVACRRPVFVALVLGAMVSLIASSGLTIRIAGPAAVSWCFVPVAEALALAAVTWRRRKGVLLSVLLDRFFAGHAAWTLLLIVTAGTLAFVPPAMVWRLLTGVCLWTAALVVVWSAYVDLCFFRFVVGAGRAAAVRDVAVLRLLTWTVVFWIFAVPAGTPRAMAQEIAEVLAEVIR
jgi:hypothetical protein